MAMRVLWSSLYTDFTPGERRRKRERGKKKDRKRERVGK
jgi:hypothetical protein